MTGEIKYFGVITPTFMKYTDDRRRRHARQDWFEQKPIKPDLAKNDKTASVFSR